MSASQHTSHQYATFVVAGQFLGVDVTEVQEVLRGQSMTRVPLAPPVVEGLINLRGQIVPALDMRCVLGLPPRPRDPGGNESAAAVSPGAVSPGAVSQGAVSVVVRSAHGAVSLQVDEIEDVIELDAGSFEAPPPNIDGALRTLFAGVHKLEGRLLLVLDTGRTVERGISQERN
ncbi:MAG: chemotaxis protein CheW [Bryobacteraceae bacterium]|jgi:purine-binding chemotaxis protein CheW